MSIDRAIDLLRDKYEAACANRIIRDPVSYALHETWKAADREYEQLFSREMEAGQEPLEDGGGLFDPDNC